MRPVSHIKHYVAVSRSLARQRDGLIKVIELYGNHSWVRENEFYIQAFDLFCKSVAVLILKVDGKGERRSQR